MNIINELASAFVKHKKNSQVIKTSIFMAVLLLGTVVFIMYENSIAELKFALHSFGSHQVEFSEIEPGMEKALRNNKKVKDIGISKFQKITIQGQKGIFVQEERKYWEEKPFTLVSGNYPTEEKEILVEKQYLNNHHLNLGDHLSIHQEDYKIVGVIDPGSYSFEKPYFYSILPSTKTKDVYEGESGINIRIWYKNIRETYQETNRFLSEFSIDPKIAEDTGRLSYNTVLLEHYFVFPGGLIPPKSVIDTWIETSIGFFLLILLFAYMIRNAFQVWNTRDINEIGLLKTSGMTREQIRSMVLRKIYFLSKWPILLGILMSYLLANGLIFIMWLNNKHSYQVFEKLEGQINNSYPLQLISPSIKPILIIFILSMLAITISALGPARKTAKLSPMEALKPYSNQKQKRGRKSLKGKIEINLGKDYLKTYRKTYWGIIVAMTIVIMSFSVLAIHQSWRTLNTKYNTFPSKYNISATIWTKDPLPIEFYQDINKTIKEKKHMYITASAKFYVNDNKGKLSNLFLHGYQNHSFNFDNPYVMVYGLEKDDFYRIGKEHNLELEDSDFLLLNQTPENTVSTPYSQRSYIPMFKEETSEVILRNHIKAPMEEIPIQGMIHTFPYDLEPISSREVSLFTTIESLEHWFEQRRIDEEDSFLYHIAIQTTRNKILEVTNSFKEILNKYIPSSDRTLTNELLQEGMEKEIKRNELFLGIGIQLIFLMIGISNAYSSFHGNLQGRKKEFALLKSVGMTSSQLKKMILYERRQIIVYVFILYILSLIGGILFQCWRKQFIFTPWEVFLHLNFFYLLPVIGGSVLGIWLSIKNGMKEILSENIMDTIREIS
ncbi:MAG: ABC transporter permease [Tissierellia bacterium]|nr:ABC transporter permease [Tissierellia bacterium]